MHIFEQQHQLQHNRHVQYHMRAGRRYPGRQAVCIIPGSATLAGTEHFQTSTGLNISNDGNQDLGVVPSVMNHPRFKGSAIFSDCFLQCFSLTSTSMIPLHKLQ